MNKMVNVIPTCIVSNKKLFQDDSSQFWKTMYIHVKRDEEGGRMIEVEEEEKRRGSKKMSLPV